MEIVRAEPGASTDSTSTEPVGEIEPKGFGP
jgi:hypothetical protein